MLPTSDCIIDSGDCTSRLSALPEGYARLVIADPPYNLGQPYAAYKDNLRYDEYLKFSYGWLQAASRCLTPNGALIFFAPEEWDAELRLYVKRELKMTERRQIIWAFTFGQAAQRNFTKSHCVISYFTKSASDFVFNADQLRVPSARQAKYNDKRAKSNGKLPDDVWALYSDDLQRVLDPDGDVILQSRVCGTFKERRKHVPNQIPVPLLERLIFALTDPGDRVVDPFLGTASTAEACARLGRRFYGCDVDPQCVAYGPARWEAGKASIVPPKDAA